MAAPTPRSLPMAAQNARPDSFRISVFDAAVKLGITNPTVAGWMFDEPVLEEEEEDERANPGLSSSASEDSMTSPTYPFTPSNTDPAMAYSAHSSFDAHPAAKQSSEVDYHSLEQYHGSSPATPLAKPNTIGKLRKAPPPRPVSPIHYFDEPPLAAPEKTTKKKKKDKKEKERDTDSDIVVEKKKDKDIDDGEGKKKGFMKRGITFRLRSKERKEAEASMPRTRSPSPPPMPPVPLPIAQRFASHAAPETRRSPSPVRGRRLSPPWRNESASDAPSNKSSFELPGETYVPPPHVQPDPVSVRRTPSPSPPQHMLDVLEEYYGTELVPKSRRSSPQPPPAPLAYHAPPAMVSYQPGDIIPSTSIIPPTAPLNIRSRSPGPSSSDNLAVSTISSDARSPSPSPYIVPTPSTSPHASRTEFTSTYTTTQPTPLVAPTPVPRRVEFVAQPLPRPTVQTMNLHTPPSSAETSPDNLTPRAASPQRRSPPHRANPTMAALTRQVSPTTSSESGHGSARRTSPPTATITRQISPPTPVDPVHAHIRLAAPPSHQKMPSSERFLSPRRPPPPPVMTGGGTSLKLLRPSARVGALPPSPRAPTAPLPSTPTNMPLPPRRSASTSPLPRSPYGPAHTTLPPRSTSPLGGPHAAAFPLPPPGLAPGFPSQPRSRGTSPYPPSSPLPATPISRGVSPAPGANGLRRGQTPAFPVRPVGRAPSVIGRPATADQVPAAFMREEPQYLAPPEVYDPPSFIPPARPRPPKPSVYRGGYESDDAESRYSVASKYSRYSRYSTGDAEGAEAVGASFMEIEQQRVDGREKLVQRVAEGSSRPAPPPDRSGYF